MQFIYSFQSEWLKKKRNLASWLVIVGAFFTPAILLIYSLVYSTKLYAASMAPNFWYALWENSWESMAIFLLPMGVILATSLITQIEFRNNTWKQLHTLPQSMTTIFFAKLSVIIVMMLQFFILFNIGFYLSGVVPCLLTKGVPYPKAPLPYQVFLKDNLLYFVACLPIIAVQYLTSLQFKNFLAPIGIGIALWILSVAVFRWQYGYIIPYTYCGFHFLQNIGKVKL
ncbi:MAG: ABC transporter permease, partial [Bacteroidetes bacterium]|nr:ABC transporter permease [Bacteroidota bacterium]